ncbi:MAG TPA: flagellar motor protein MotD [Steroidobacteraceae bacterium]|nr:flagellar motor protein MotD [Steroidobacteraceae bacterium]
MARKKHHEEHQNHEAWAIPYGDLVTLLLALFVVLYSMSSVNVGKYRILSDALVAAFRGAPTTTTPVPVGKPASGKGGDQMLVGVRPTALVKLPSPVEKPKPVAPPVNPMAGALVRMAAEIEKAMKELIDRNLVTVRQEKLWLEVEIRTDILFRSGDADINAQAIPVLRSLADILKPFPNPIHVEGHTDNRPIRTAAFPSNWELSAARAATVVHLFVNQGVDPQRLKIVGLAEQAPIATNDTAEGRNANRRVRIVVLESADVSEDAYAVRLHSDATAANEANALGVAEPNGMNRVLLSVPAEELSKKLAPSAPEPLPEPLKPPSKP